MIIVAGKNDEGNSGVGVWSLVTVIFDALHRRLASLYIFIRRGIGSRKIRDRYHTLYTFSSDLPHPTFHF
jgi:hypothetical protein